YALFPHMSVQENVEYGLRVKRVARAERRRRAGEALEMVRLAGYGSRKPVQLSGGQRQRVALARSIVTRPQVLLLDEPLGALDLKLRGDMQTELKDLQRVLGITFCYVTHDQAEAFSMSDRVAVMNGGLLEQVGAPEEVYRRPRSAFVADFVGAANQLPGTVSASPADGRYRVAVTSCGERPVAGREGLAERQAVIVVVRPEDLRVEPAGGDGLQATVVDIAFLGAQRTVRLEAPGVGPLVATTRSTGEAVERGATVTIDWADEDAWVVANARPTAEAV
ncbi:MAG: putative spermidine/putrescine transport system ATP-binding protein, partial [Solirubrobacteraceae bacterium]|nr:putative spermidine/putrescine transport system ATP-binding protein [Solirubrobacteraceae bacterium]